MRGGHQSSERGGDGRGFFLLLLLKQSADAHATGTHLCLSPLQNSHPPPLSKTCRPPCAPRSLPPPSPLLAAASRPARRPPARHAVRPTTRPHCRAAPRCWGRPGWRPRWWGGRRWPTMVRQVWGAVFGRCRDTHREREGRKQQPDRRRLTLPVDDAPPPTDAPEFTTYYGTASPPTSYGGYGGNAKETAK